MPHREGPSHDASNVSVASDDDVAYGGPHNDDATADATVADDASTTNDADVNVAATANHVDAIAAKEP